MNVRMMTQGTQGQDTSWMETALIALVLLSLVSMMISFAQLLHDLLCSTYAEFNDCDSNDLNNCHENANCTNTEGSFICSCDLGYTGDGVNCTSKFSRMERNIPCVECIHCLNPFCRHQ